MRRTFRVIALGLGALLITFGLTFAAYGLAGKDLSQPAKIMNVGGDLAPVAATSREENKVSASPAPTQPAHHHKHQAQTPIKVTPSPTPFVIVPQPTYPTGGTSGTSGSGSHSGGGDSGEPHDD
jgi:cytoskeletal protein RodZ